MLRGFLVIFGLLERAFGHDDAQQTAPRDPPQKSPPLPPTARRLHPFERLLIVNPSPERRRLTQVSPGVLVANHLDDPLMPGERIDYFAPSPLFAPGGLLSPKK